MASTSYPARNMWVCRAISGVALPCASTKFLWKVTLAQRGDFGARCQCRIADWPCYPPPPAPIGLVQGKHPISWGRGSHFHSFLGCNSPLVSHQHANELGHGHHSGKGWTWTHQQISHETSGDGSGSSACVPICGIVGDDMSRYGASDWTSWVIPPLLPVTPFTNKV